MRTPAEMHFTSEEKNICAGNKAALPLSSDLNTLLVVGSRLLKIIALLFSLVNLGCVIV